MRTRLAPFVIAAVLAFGIGGCEGVGTIASESDGTGASSDAGADDSGAEVDTGDPETDAGGPGADTGGPGPDVGPMPDGGPDPDPDPDPDPFVPAPATLHRLTADQYRASVEDLFGVSVTSPLEEDTSLHGFVSVAMSELTIPPRTAQQFADASWEVADAIMADETARRELVGCDPGVDLEGCLRGWIAAHAPQVWRRPLTGDEVESLTALGVEIGTELRDPWYGVGAVIATLLQSPHFVFRVEIAEPNPDDLALRRYTSWEMASRLSYFIWGTTPDQALLDAAAAGELVTDDGIRAQVERMWEDPRARSQMSAFFDEFIGLQRLDAVQKDAEMFPQMTDDLRESMRQEVQLLFEEVVFDAESDFRDLLTTDVTFVDDVLAAVYGLPQPGSDDPVRTTLPPEHERGGLLGRAGPLALFSHATINSPTFRGRFVRANLLCQDVPPPPEGVVTELESPDPDTPTTLRQRLDQHRSDPVCAGCHDQMDPLGFALEHFDPIGQYRTLDNGLPIDASGELDGTVIDGGLDLGMAVSEHPWFARCVSRRLYRHATGHLEERSELRLMHELGVGFVDDGYRFRELVVRLVLSEGFRLASPPRGSACEGEGETRACDTSCGVGTETCSGGAWSGCNAPTPLDELCDGADNDCDGVADESLVRSCDNACGLGTQSCVAGAWGECEGLSPQPEVCDGADNDCDGMADEGIGASVVDVPFTTLSSHHPPCDGFTERIGPNCNAAIHRFCGALTCSSTGLGPAESGASSLTVTCMPGERVVHQSTTYTELSGHHPGCTTASRIGPDCNAAIHRYCGSLGHTSGYGPVENSGDGAAVICTPDGEVVTTSYTELTTHHGGCSAGGERIGPNCNAAIHRYCRARGAATGFGPVENSGDVAVVTCLSP